MSRPFHSIYIDESSQNDHQFLVLGAIIIPQDQIAAFETDLGAARLPELPYSELKWQKISRAKIKAYERFIGVFFQYPDAHFHSIAVDTTQQSHGVFNAGDRETGFNKEIYQLVLKCGRLYRSSLFHVFPDERSARQPPEELRTIINRGMHKKFGKERDWPVRRLHYKHSHELMQLQLADIFSGAIASRLNGHHRRADASVARTSMSGLILSRAKISDPAKDTPVSGKFTIWHRRLRPVVLRPSGVPLEAGPHPWGGASNYGRR